MKSLNWHQQLDATDPEELQANRAETKAKS